MAKINNNKSINLEVFNNMITHKDTEPKVTVGKRNISVKGVSIKDGILVDENGSIVPELEKILPDWVTEFDMKISIELPDEE